VAYLRTVASGNGAKIASAVKIVKAILRKLYSFANNGAVYIYIYIEKETERRRKREKGKKRARKREREGERE